MAGQHTLLLDLSSPGTAGKTVRTTQRQILVTNPERRRQSALHYMPRRELAP